MTREKKLQQALQWSLQWIDSVPSDTHLPTMPGFDRDYVNDLLSDDQPATLEDCFRGWGFERKENGVWWRDADYKYIHKSPNKGAWVVGRNNHLMDIEFPNLTSANFPHVMEALGIEKGEMK